jgi:hypothetical protein
MSATKQIVDEREIISANDFHEVSSFPFWWWRTKASKSPTLSITTSRKKVAGTIRLINSNSLTRVCDRELYVSLDSMLAPFFRAVSESKLGESEMGWRLWWSPVGYSIALIIFCQPCLISGFF